MANALSALGVLGLAGEIRSQSVGGVQGGLKNPNGKALVAIPADELAKTFGTVTVMHRADLLALLVKQIEPERIHLGRSCVGFEQAGEGITALFQNDETAHGDALIGADGLRSVIRQQLPGNPPVRYSGYTAWRAVVEFEGGRNLTIGETWGRGRRFGIIPMSRNRVYWFATSNAAEGERNPEGRSKDMLSRLFHGWHDPIGALIEAAREDSILQNDIYDMNPLPSCVRGRVALLGDAAHAMTPNLGQGACQAIEDAIVLAACLRKNARVEPALVEYERRRMPRTRQFVLRSRRLGAFAQWENPILCWVRDTAMRATPTKMVSGQARLMPDFELLESSEKGIFT
jgi:2-polyprenyl-6-methoxyphenol hydroxylase-like FAD-dependent oxidoreductase